MSSTVSYNNWHIHCLSLQLRSTVQRRDMQPCTWNGHSAAAKVELRVFLWMSLGAGATNVNLRPR